ncbi:MAG: hypothetical protein RQ801_00160 [Spirochaetaceae bacterium]|nr:hypothetical protein [Spirochaetaceae bacterium]MDT8296681.1 hypothetical protein [Spirochaetaceae bacterium]
MIIKTIAYPRAALIGNPSDGYFGKTIAFTFSDFQTDITLYPSDHIRILPMKRDRTVFDDIEDFRDDVTRYGYYGGIRIIKASIARFLAYCRKKDLSIDGGNFTLRCHTSIPAHLGLAGSSSIITAVFRALMKYYDVPIALHELANEIWATEIQELSISGGLQDRVAQSYQGITYMDFNETLMKTRGYGEYHPLNPESLPNLYLAYDVRAAESSDIVHNNLRYRFDQGDEDVVSAMKEFAGLADRVKDMFETGNYSGLSEIINANFNLRSSICDISRRNEELVHTARSTGASAKFTGSGGAIIGTFTDAAELASLKTALSRIGAEVIVPTIAWPE